MTDSRQELNCLCFWIKAPLGARCKSKEPENDFYPNQDPESLAYSGCLLERASGQRADENWVAELLDESRGSQLIPIWRNRCLISGNPPVPVISANPIRNAILRELCAPVFLGLDGTAGVFAVDLSSLPEARAVEAVGAERVLDVRRLAGLLSPAEAALIAYARGLLYWNRHQEFCGTCGCRTIPREGGHLRVCERDGCGRMHFPRIEPAVIMLVESAGAPRRCLLARHKGSAPDGYSTLGTDGWIPGQRCG